MVIGFEINKKLRSFIDKKYQNKKIAFLTHQHFYGHQIRCNLPKYKEVCLL